jgi:DNA repair exonuclease SbcCD ATPase subunit
VNMSLYELEKLSEQRQSDLRRGAELRRMVGEGGRSPNRVKSGATAAARLALRLALTVWRA